MWLNGGDCSVVKVLAGIEYRAGSRSRRAEQPSMAEMKNLVSCRVMAGGGVM
jgi:hypothetical protein